MYDNDLDFWVHVVGPEDTRLVFVFQRIDLEYQKDCLYDFVEVRSVLLFFKYALNVSFYNTRLLISIEMKTTFKNIVSRM